MFARNTALQALSPSTPSHLVEAIGKLIAKLEAIESDKRYRKNESRHAAMNRIAGAECDRLRREMEIRSVEDEAGITQDLASGSVATLQKYFGFYRRALEAMELSPINSYEVEMGGRGGRYVGRKHVCHSVFKLSPIESQVLSDKQSEGINNKRDPRRADTRTKMEIRDVEGYIATARSLLAARSYLDVAIGIQALTGRRAYEVCCTAALSDVEADRATFSGQAKGKSIEKEAFEIPILGGLGLEVSEALERLRATKPELVGLDNPSFNRRCQKDYNARVRRHFAPSIALWKDGGMIGATSHGLRAAYGRLAFETFGRAEGYTESEILPYLSRVLGHAENDFISGQSYNYVSVTNTAA